VPSTYTSARQLLLWSGDGKPIVAGLVIIYFYFSRQLRQRWLAQKIIME
jgi:hypothetical protein